MKCLNISYNTIQCIHTNDFTGIPSQISLLQNLQVLKMSHCNLRYIPPAIWKCHQLQELDISHNKINVLPPDVGSLIKLCQLNMQYTSITTIPVEIVYCQQLEGIQMWGNAIESLPDVLRYLPNLQTISINFRNFASGIDNYMEGLLRKGQIKSEHLPTVIFEISGLSHLDLESTKINHLPARCSSKLQELVLANNFFQIVPNLVLTSNLLCFLDLSGNVITSLPTEIGNLTNLKKFWINNNKIELLPNSIEKLIVLEELSLSRNLLTTFPETIGNLKALHTLVADHNFISSLPNTIGELQELQTLDLTGNCLESLPIQMLNMKNLTVAHQYRKFSKYGLWLHKNPISKPQQAIWQTDNPTKIYEYLKTIQVEKLESSQRQKLIVLGGSQSGKTSLIRTITSEKSSLTTLPTESTSLIEFSSWKTKNSIDIVIQDTEGGEYFRTTICPYFLDATALYLIVFNVNDYSDGCYQQRIGCWIDTLLLYCPNAVVKVVGTFLDLCCKEAAKEKLQSISSKLQAHLACQQTKETDEIKMLNKEMHLDSTDSNRKPRTQKLPRKTADKLLQLQTEIVLVSASENLNGIPELISNLEATVFNNNLFPNVRRTAKSNWHVFSQAMKAISGYYVNWKKIIELAKKCEILERELPESLLYLQNTGKVIWHGHVEGLNKIIVHRPRKLVEMMRSMFRTDMSDFLDFERNRILKSLGKFDEISFGKAKQNLITQGHMCKSLLKCICLCFPQEKEKTDIINFARIMQEFNLCYLAPQYDQPTHKREELLPFLVIPSYSQMKWSKEEDILWIEWSKANKREQIELGTIYKFSRTQLKPLFSRLSCKINSLVKHRHDWTDVVTAMVSNNLLQIIHKNEQIYIILCGSEKQDLQMLLNQLETIMDTLISFSPGLTYTKCYKGTNFRKVHRLA